MRRENLNSHSIINNKGLFFANELFSLSLREHSVQLPQYDIATLLTMAQASYSMIHDEAQRGLGTSYKFHAESVFHRDCMMC